LFLPDDQWRGKKVTVMGLGRFGGGLGVTTWLCRKGAEVTVSDQAPAEQLKESIAKLDGCRVQLHLGGHDEKDFTTCDVLVANPAVPFDSPYLAAARQAGAAITTEINLFLARCPCPVVGITGSAGKSTTTAMIGAMLARHVTAHVGGNIGKSLLEELGDIRPDHVVVLELSSFQLSYLPLLAKSPHVAVVTNLQPNHLDRHIDMDDYARAKKQLFAFQGHHDVLVLNADDAAMKQWAGEAKGKVVFFSADAPQPFKLRLPGRHNQANAQAAFAAAGQFGVPRELAQAALLEFTGLPHRLEFVAQRNGVSFYNDSKCTTPDEAVVALEAFEKRSMVVIAGGYDKKIDMSNMCRKLAERAGAVVAVGQTGPSIADAVESLRGPGQAPAVVRVGRFDDAVAAAAGLAKPGQVVLLAPGCASFDQFKNYEQRGERFRELVK
jgi:UDP-N-acetylmuramoylalanine--D-glutamate ligase